MNAPFVAYLDETGDHSLGPVDKNYPVFALSIAIFKHEQYTSRVQQPCAALKVRHFGDEDVILHSYEIRKQLGPFSLLANRVKREAFQADLSQFVSEAPFVSFFVLIDKTKHVGKYGSLARNPYSLSLKFAIERLCHFCEHYEVDHLPIIAESRGSKEDARLASVFSTQINGTEFRTRENLAKHGFTLEFRPKMENMAGHQIADLCAYPLARHYLSGTKSPAYEIANKKLFLRYGLQLGRKVFPL